MTSSRTARASLFVIGLALAGCGGQAVGDLDAESESSGLTESSRPANPTIPFYKEAVEPEPNSSSVELADESRRLAPGFVELESALPERVLDGLGDPIGRPPTTLSIPSQGVDSADVFAVGLEPNGELEVPGADGVGWYQFGVGVDGGQGSAVLAAHIAFDGRDGVFRNLADVVVGDQIVVGDGAEELVYEAVSIDQYNKFELPIGDLFAESGEERLVLITCGGSFNPDLRSYDDNVVVVAVPV